MKQLILTEAELAIIYKLTSKIIKNTCLDLIPGDNFVNKCQSFNLTTDDIKILTNINKLLSALF